MDTDQQESLNPTQYTNHQQPYKNSSRKNMVAEIYPPHSSFSNKNAFSKAPLPNGRENPGRNNVQHTNNRLSPHLLTNPQPSSATTTSVSLPFHAAVEQHHFSLGSKATNMSYETQSTFGMPSIQDSNSMRMANFFHHQNGGGIPPPLVRIITLPENKPISSIVASSHHHSVINHSAGKVEPINNNHSQHTQQSYNHPQHQHYTPPHHLTANSRMQNQHVEKQFSSPSLNHNKFADPHPSPNSLENTNLQSQKADDLSPHHQLFKRKDSNQTLNHPQMQEMLEFDLHLSNSDMRQLFSDGYYNPLLLSPGNQSSPSGNNQQEGISVTTTNSATNLTRIDYIKCTTNGVFTSFDSLKTAQNDSNSSSSSHGRASPDTSETQGLTWYENQQVVLHLWVRIKAQYLNRFKTIFDDLTSGNLNPALVPPSLKLHIIYRNAEYTAKEVLIHEFLLDPIQCYQKYLKNKEQEDKSDPLQIYTRNLDFSLERKTVKVVNKRLRVRFEMFALPCTTNNEPGTTQTIVSDSRITLLLSPTIVCLTARSFFFDKRRIKSAKVGLNLNSTSLSTSNPQTSTTSQYGVASSNSASSNSSPTGIQLRQVSSSLFFSENQNVKHNTLVGVDNTLVAAHSQSIANGSTNHQYQNGYNPYPPIPLLSKSQVAQFSTPANVLPPMSFDQQDNMGGGNFKSKSPSGPTSQQVYHITTSSPPTSSAILQRPNISASSLMLDNNHYHPSESFTSYSHVKQSSSGSSPLPSLSTIFSSNPPPKISINDRSISTPPYAQAHASTRNQFLQLIIPVHSLPEEIVNDPNEMLVNDFLEYVNTKYRKSRNFK